VSSNFRAYNINFRNTYGTAGQAVAVAANGDQQGYYACGFYGYQDTLYAKSGRQYYSNCYIEGAVDFIFGAAAAWFGECTVASNGGGYITASSRTTTADDVWYVFDHSTVSSPVPAGSVTVKVAKNCPASLSDPGSYRHQPSRQGVPGPTVACPCPHHLPKFRVDRRRAP
jgi:pectin methylesterase-like acyl-CoA thioesterase